MTKGKKEHPLYRGGDGNVLDQSEEYQNGYSDGWFQQPEKEGKSEQYSLGYAAGWNKYRLGRR